MSFNLTQLAHNCQCACSVNAGVLTLESGETFDFKKTEMHFEALLKACQMVLAASEDGGDMEDIDWDQLRSAVAKGRHVLRPAPSKDWIYSGAEVFWTDPDTESACSRYAKVDFVHTEGPITGDSIVILRREDDGTTFEARADELS